MFWIKCAQSQGGQSGPPLDGNVTGCVGTIIDRNSLDVCSRNGAGVRRPHHTRCTEVVTVFVAGAEIAGKRAWYAQLTGSRFSETRAALGSLNVFLIRSQESPESVCGFSRGVC